MDRHVGRLLFMSLCKREKDWKNLFIRYQSPQIMSCFVFDEAAVNQH